jgi:hypothetical protein
MHATSWQPWFKSLTIWFQQVLGHFARPPFGLEFSLAISHSLGQDLEATVKEGKIERDVKKPSQTYVCG